MKSLRRKAETSMVGPAQPGTLKNGLMSMKRGLLMCATAATVALAMPLLEGSAMAQPVPSPEAKQPERPATPEPARPVTARKLYTVKGAAATITDGAKSHSVYILAQNLKPSLEVQGPARLTLQVYPVVKIEGFANGVQEQQRSIICTSGPAGGAQTTSHYSGNTRTSAITHPDVDSAKLVIGTPIRFTADVGTGAQQFQLLSPHGFLQIISVEPIALPAPRQVPRRRIIIDTDAPKKTEKPKPKPVPKEEGPRTLFSMTGDRVHISGFGPDRNSGDLNVTGMLGHIPVTRSLSLLVGAYVTSYGLVLESPAAKSSFRSLSTDVMAGIGYRSGRHSLEAFGLAGYRHLWATLSAADGRSLTTENRMAEYGGSLRYAYEPYFSMALSGTDNQFNPFMARLVGTLPRGLPWVKGAAPSLAFTFNWLRAAVSSNREAMIGGMELSHDAFDVIAVADLPLLRLKMFTLSAIAGGELVLSRSGDVWGTGLFGGALSLEHKGFLVSFSGMSSLEGMPFLTLNMRYSR